MNIGGLYTYKHTRRLHKTQELNEWHKEVELDTPFVVLDIQMIPSSFSGLVKSYKILAATGEIGWISGVQEFFHELS
jgi:hypothetical protein